MKNILLAAGVLAATLLIGVLVVGGYALSKYNKAKTLQVQYNAKLTANTTTFDNMWKKIQGVVEVTDLQRDALQKVMVAYAQARSSGQDGAGLLAKWVQESVPNMDTSTFNNVQNILAGSRDSWTFNQMELVDIAREYNQMLQVQPSGFVLGMFGFKELKPQVITSTRTENVFATGKDDDVSIIRK